MNTVDRLNAGEVVDLDGLLLVKDPTTLIEGDLYVAERNTGPKLLTVRHVRDSFIVPTTPDYCFDTYECVKVRDLP